MSSRFRSFRTILAVLAALAIVGGIQAFTAAAPAHAAGSDLDGCPSGAVCIYQDADPSHHSAAYITSTYWSYGAHNLANEYGQHWVANNQYGGVSATTAFCYGYNGVNCSAGSLIGGFAAVEDLTPVNSIVLNQP